MMEDTNRTINDFLLIINGNVVKPIMSELTFDNSCCATPEVRIRSSIAYGEFYNAIKNRGCYNAPAAIKRVIFNPPATIVLWTDGTKTVVKAENEPFDKEKGLAMAICKKTSGNKGNYFEAFKKYCHDEEPKTEKKSLRMTKEMNRLPIVPFGAPLHEMVEANANERCKAVIELAKKTFSIQSPSKKYSEHKPDDRKGLNDHV